MEGHSDVITTILQDGFVKDERNQANLFQDKFSLEIVWLSRWNSLAVASDANFLSLIICLAR